MALLIVIRRWHLRDGVPIREIARRTGLSRNTIRKYLASDVVEPRYPARESPSKLDAFEETLASWLVRESRRSRKQLYRDLVALGYPGSYDRVAAFMLRAYPLQTHEMLFDAHNHALAALGGVPTRAIYDNMKTAVDRVLRGKAREVNARSRAMASHFLFEAEFCNPAAGWEKGQIEKNVQDARWRISGRACRRPMPTAS